MMFFLFLFEKIVMSVKFFNPLHHSSLRSTTLEGNEIFSIWHVSNALFSIVSSSEFSQNSTHLSLWQLKKSISSILTTLDGIFIFSSNVYANEFFSKSFIFEFSGKITVWAVFDLANAFSWIEVTIYSSLSCFTE